MWRGARPTLPDQADGSNLMSDRMLARVSRIAVAVETGVILAPLTPVVAGIACVTGLWVRFSGGADLDDLWLEMLVLGSPAVIPPLHLSAERWLPAIGSMESAR